MGICNRIKKKLVLVFRSHYKVARVYSFKTYSGLSKHIQYYPLSIERKTTVYPIHFFDEPLKEPIKCDLSDVYYVNIENCKIIGQSNIILTKNKYLLYDYLAEKSKSYVNITDKGLFLFLNKVIHFGKSYLLNHLGVSKDVIDKGIMLSGNFSDNYYHFVFEFLVKFDLISKAKIEKEIPIILDSIVKEIPQFKELISIFNEEKRKIIYIDRQILYSINELHYFSFINEVPPNLKRKTNEIKSTDYAFDIKSILYLRSTVFKYFNNNLSSTPKKIFISRKNCSKRRNNEQDFYPILKKFGYVTVSPENLTLKEQFLYFSNAEHIIAGSGAALTNIIFCKPQCEILVFQSIHADITVFSSIAAYTELNMIYLTPLNQTTKSHPDFNISIELLEKYLKEYDNKLTY